MLKQLGVYAAIAAGVLIAGLFALVFIQRAKLDTAEAEQARVRDQLAAVLQTNKQQGEVINRLTEQRLIDDRFVSLMNTQLAAIREEAEATTAKIIDLERVDPDAKSFLSIPVPDSVKRVLGRNPGPAAGPRGPGDTNPRRVP